MRAFLLARSKEASTWRGITLFLTALGVPLAPQLAEAIVTAGLGVAGLLGVLLPDGRN
jgi:hypothetical protein